jgi:CBS domain-containing protein
MTFDISEPAARLRGAITRGLGRLGFRDDSFLLILAVIVGTVTAATGAGNFVVVDETGAYAAMVVADDIQMALLDRDAIPLLVVGELMRADVPLVKHTDDLSSILEAFARHEVSHLPVTMNSRPNHVIGLISRAGLMRTYQQKLTETK